MVSGSLKMQYVVLVDAQLYVCGMGHWIGCLLTNDLYNNTMSQKFANLYEFIPGWVVYMNKYITVHNNKCFCWDLKMYVGYK